MVKWTTPELEITVPEIDLCDFDEIHVTLKQGKTVVDIKDPVIVDEHTMTISLSQAQTGSFGPGLLGLQVNCISGAQRIATEITQLAIDDNLLLREVVV